MNKVLYITSNCVVNDDIAGWGIFAARESNVLICEDLETECSIPWVRRVSSYLDDGKLCSLTFSWHSKKDISGDFFVLWFSWSDDEKYWNTSKKKHVYNDEFALSCDDVEYPRFDEMIEVFQQPIKDLPSWLSEQALLVLEWLKADVCQERILGRLEGMSIERNREGPKYDYGPPQHLIEDPWREMRERLERDAGDAGTDAELES